MWGFRLRWSRVSCSASPQPAGLLSPGSLVGSGASGASMDFSSKAISFSKSLSCFIFFHPLSLIVSDVPFIVMCDF